MPRWQRVYVTACAAVIGFALAYAGSDFGSWPRLTYFPYEGSWSIVGRPASTVPMRYLGTVLWGAGGAVSAAAATWAAARLSRRPLPDWLVQVVGGWALTAFALAGIYFTWNLWPF